MPSSPSSPSSPSRAVVRVTVLAVVVVGACAGLVFWWLHDDRPRAEVGATVAAPEATDRIIGLSSELTLPFGEYQVLLSESLQELPPPCCLDEPVDLRAPEGGSFVGVEVTLDLTGTREPLVEPGATPPAPALTLVVERPGLEPETVDYPVTVPPDAWERNNLANVPIRTYVAIDGRPEIDEVALRVDYDGVSQVVSPHLDLVVAEDARRIPADVAQVVQSCGSVRPPSGFVLQAGAGPECSLGIERLAYVGGLGWAPSGEQWLVVTPYVARYASLNRRVGAQSYFYDMDGLGETPEAEVTVDGDPPAASWRDRSDNLVSVFAEPATRDPLVSTAVSYDVRVSDDDPRPVDEVTLTWRSPLGAGR